MKGFAKSIIVWALAKRVKRLLANNKLIVIGVAGSIGKTSTKRAIAEVLSTAKRVQWQDGNYNDLVSVPLVFFGLDMPSLFSPMAWWRTLKEIDHQLKQPYPYDVVVLELGTDGPGQIASFKQYLQLDIGVVTAIAPEHMEFFGDLQTVAREEFAIASYTKQLIMNLDMVAAEYQQPAMTYSLRETAANAYLTATAGEQGGFDVTLKTAKSTYKAFVSLLGQHQLYAVTVAGMIAEQCGLTSEQITEGLAAITVMPGRMQRLKGKQDVTIIDDSYNASPEAVKAALDTLYGLKAPQRIALLGNMNELGAVSAQLHTEVGEHCDAKKLDLVITLGLDANNYLAEAAEAAGCQVRRVASPYEAGELLTQLVKPGAAVLVKGSQNGVFAEEAIKPLLADAHDIDKLVRQSPHWLAVKSKQFGRTM